MSGPVSDLSPVKRALLALEQMQAKLDRIEREKREPIAIIGMSCRLPGGADTPERLWQILRDGVDVVSEVPPSRWAAGAFYDPDPDAPGKMYSKAGGFLRENIDEFDASFFRISPREAAAMDPQQRLLLEVTWEALERAGYASDALRPRQTGVFTGISTHDYSQLLTRRGDYADINTYSGTGNTASIASGRIAYLLGLHGPALSLDTACSSSLVAVHLACQSLRLRESDLALAGGVNLMLTPEPTICLARMRALSVNGRCRTFDAAADGFVRGEGCAILVLKRLSDAERDGDDIHAVIRGSAVNHDGRSSGLTAPNGPAQEAVIRTALSHAAVRPEQISYIEAHGTGTPLGDPIEVNALRSVFGGDSRSRPFYLGSAKTNFGHLEAAAGVVGLMKAVLSMRYKVVPKHLHLTTPNPYIDWGTVPAVVPSESTPWITDGAPRMAGVSSFGISGTNAHVVVEEAALREARPVTPDRPLHLLAVSAMNDRSLSGLVSQIAAHVAAADDALPDICFSANTGRPHHARRIAVVARTKEELIARLRDAKAGAEPAQARIAFLFTGQGSQYSGMAQRLYETHPRFRQTIDRCSAIWDRHLDVSLPSVVFRSEGEALLDQTKYTQPALFAIEFALADLWRSWGVEPQAVLGHSVGEYVAAAVAGYMSADDALELLIERARLMQMLPAGGAMAAVAAEEAAVTPYLEAHRDAVAVAAINAPAETVISGDSAAMASVTRALEADGIAHRMLRTSHAFHSPLIEPILGPLSEAARKVRFGSGSIPLVSNVTGEIADSSMLSSPDYWSAHARAVVRFAQGIGTLHGHGITHFVEIGPAATLTNLARRIPGGSQHTWLASMQKGKEEWEQMLLSLSRLYAAGVEIDWREFDRPFARRRVSLPAYAFDRTRHWTHFQRMDGEGRQRTSLLGTPLRSPALQADVYETELSVDAVPLLGGHRIAGLTIFSASSYVEIASRAAAIAFGSESATIENLTFTEALVVPETEPVTVQTIVDSVDADSRSVRIVSRSATGGSAEWRTHATATLRRFVSDSVASSEPKIQQEPNSPPDIAADVFYDAFSRSGAEYNGAFRSVDRVWVRDSEVMARVELAKAHRSSAYKFHPGLLDSCFQLFGPLLVRADGPEAAYLPVRIALMSLYRPLPDEVWCRATLQSFDAGGGAVGNLTITDMRGAVVAVVAGLAFKRLPGRSADVAADSRDLLYRIEWERQPLRASTTDTGAGNWLIAGDSRNISRRVAELLSAAGNQCEVVDGDDPELARIATSKSRDGVIALFDSRATPFDRAYERALSLAQGLAGTSLRRRLWFVTRGAQWVEGSGDERALGFAGLWGLARVIALENPELGCVCLDLDASGGEDEAAQLVEEINASSADDQVAFRHGMRLVPRLARITSSSAKDDQVSQLQILSRGSLDNLTLVRLPRRKPGPAQVEIRVRATGLNFRDVLNALGMYPGDPGQLGLECAGIVESVGDGVTEFQAGDEVIAFSSGSFSDRVLSDARFVVRKPRSITFEQAATIPITFLTAFHALHHLAQIRQGERVLIHAAAGGVGMAAAQLALRAGAEVFGTAGTAEKRDKLKAMGIRHVMDSRSLAFADEVRRSTDGRGVDVVLNSLVGDYITRSMDVLAPHGRFVEIGKIEVWDLAKVAGFRPDISYFSFDLGEIAAHRPDVVQSMFRTLSDGLAGGSLQPLPYTSFEIDDAVSAFRYMAQSKHIGKVVLVQKQQAATRGCSIHAGATYLITGGAGGLGLKVAGWLADGGARHLVLASRSGAHSAAALETIRQLEARGVTVGVRRADVSDADAVNGLFAEFGSTLPPLRGIIHAAGIVDDAVLAGQTALAYRNVMQPKFAAAWNLHKASLAHALDFFVTFSSTAAVFGSPGQANYAAANAAMDALAHYRASTGLPARTINWGPWADIGMATASGAAVQRRWRAQGVELLSVARGLAALQEALQANEVQVVALDANWDRLLSQFPTGQEPPFLSRLRRRAAKTAPAQGFLRIARNIQAASGEERRLLVTDYIRAQVAKVLGHASSDAVDTRTPLTDMGFDSLMVIELSNSITSLMGQKYEPSALLDTPTIEQLAVAVAGRMSASASRETSGVA